MLNVFISVKWYTIFGQDLPGILLTVTEINNERLTTTNADNATSAIGHMNNLKYLEVLA